MSQDPMMQEEFEKIRAEFLQLLDLDILDIEAPERMPMTRPDLLVRMPPVARALCKAMITLEERIKDDELQGNVKTLEVDKAKYEAVQERMRWLGRLLELMPDRKPQ